MFPVELMLHFLIDLGICAPISVSGAAVKFILLAALCQLYGQTNQWGTGPAGLGRRTLQNTCPLLERE